MKGLPHLIAFTHCAQALTEEVNRKLCEVLTELAEDIVQGLAESGAGEAPAVAPKEPAAEGVAEEAEAEGPSSNVNGVDEVAALAAYNDAMAAVMRESDMSSKVGVWRACLCVQPPSHPPSPHAASPCADSFLLFGSACTYTNTCMRPSLVLLRTCMCSSAPTACPPL